ncbi:unnamed protein product [Bursaphelenchus xylophilus]|uniref:(pine wood nematode) hypothetical protein n=1 Tax=Bursaphelenchus xylophilus TaxID=6326 RepID=A0A1I7SCR4_BURXY|nr:unnamed protein product [Bursaphelenchus xylophilus]CAG9093658.1 unnamed protein product [Bursaphelenchus xylophilus]
MLGQAEKESAGASWGKRKGSGKKREHWAPRKGLHPSLSAGSGGLHGASKGSGVVASRGRRDGVDGRGEQGA